jgi:hypothetical protein
MIVPNKFNGYNRDGTRNLFMGGGGGGGQTTSTVQNTNVPEYARPYVETMLGATQEQLFQGNRTPVTTDPVTGETTGGQFNITGFKPYQAYGGQYDAQGNAILGPDGKPIYDAGKAIAGFSPMQIAAQQGIAGMKLDPNYANAASRADSASLDAIRTAAIASQYGSAGYKAGLQGQQSGLTGQKLGIAGGAKYGEMGAEYGAQGQQLGLQGGQLGTIGGARYGEMGAVA